MKYETKISIPSMRYNCIQKSSNVSKSKTDYLLTVHVLNPQFSFSCDFYRP